MDNISLDNQDEIKKLARKGRELGYILISELNKTIKGFALADQKYIKDTMEKLKIQKVNSPEEYDEYKYPNSIIFLSSKYFATGTRQTHIVDVESTTTFEMAKNLKELIKISDGPILLATDPLHHKRTILTLKKQNFNILIPDNYITYDNSRNIKDNYSIIPSVRSIDLFNNIIYEVLGITWYYFTGRI